MTRIISGVFALSLVLFASDATAQQGGATPPRMSFFITSVGKGDGANLGGLAGADAHCQSLAGMANGGDLTWRAYLSTAAAGATPAVNARDRIGRGPWYNARGALVAANVEDLHGDLERDRNQINQANALSEKGTEVPSANPNQHDILTGSDTHGRAIPFMPASATTCNNWTSNAAGSAVVGHHNRAGGGNSSWNAAHASRSCSQADLVATGGAGLFYCFAVN